MDMNMKTNGGRKKVKTEQRPEETQNENTVQLADDEDQINTFARHTWKEYLTLIVEGKCLHVSKAILGTVSPVFDKMFSADFAEKNKAELELPDKRFSDVHEFLKCFYPGQVNEVSEENVDQILPLADEYQITNVKSDCESVLLSRIVEKSGSHNVYKTLYTANLYNLPQLFNKCLKLASETPYCEVESSTLLSDKLKRTIYEYMAWSCQKQLKRKQIEMSYLIRQNKVLRTAARYQLECPGYKFLDMSDLSQTDCATLNFTTPIKGMLTSGILIPVEIFSSEVKVHLFSTSVKLSLEIDFSTMWMVDFTGGVVIKSVTNFQRDWSNKFQLKFRKENELTHKFNSAGVLRSEAGYVYHDNSDVEIFLIAKRRRKPNATTTMVAQKS